MARGKKKETLTPENRLQAALVPESEQPYPVPENWCWTYLGCVSDVVTGGTPSKKHPEYYGGLFPFFKPTDLDFGRHVVEASEYLTDEGKMVSRIIPEQSTAVCCIGSIGKCGFLEVEGTTNQQINSAIPKFNPLFFYYYCNTHYFNEELWSKASATTISIVNKSKMESCVFPLPPLPEQQRIVDRIESLFAKLDEAKQRAQDALDSFETRKAAILHKAFTGELIGKHSTATTTLEEITTCIRIGPFGSALHKEDYILGGVPVVNPKHIVQQKIVPEEKTTVSVQKAEELSSYILQKNDIILGRRGDMGRSAPVTDLETGWLCGTGSMIIRLKSGYNAKFYSQIIASQASVRYLEENSVGSTMKNLNEKVVRLLPLPDFAVDEQLKIVHILDNLLAKEQQAKEAAEEVLEQIELIKKSILARAFRGELGTNDPSEESAVELLKQVSSY